MGSNIVLMFNVTVSTVTGHRFGSCKLKDNMGQAEQPPCHNTLSSKVVLLFTVTVFTGGSKLELLFIVIISAVSFVEPDPVIWKDNMWRTMPSACHNTRVAK